jgi:hypothetical protein
MAKNMPTEGDLLVLFDNLYEVFTLDLDGEVWIVSDSMVQFVDVSAVTGMALVSRFTEYEFFTSDMYYKVESDRYYTYLQDFIFEYYKLNLTGLTKIVYNIEDDFTGDLFIARRIR